MSTVTGRWIGGFRVTAFNQALDFVDGASATVYAATLRLGDYTAGQLAAEVQRAMRAETDDTNQTCAFDFSTRKFTLSGAATFQLLWLNGDNADNDCSGLLGFSVAADDTGAVSYTSDDEAGTGVSLAAGVFTWAPVDPAVTNSPVTAGVDGAAAKLLQRKVRAVQHETDGGLRETIYFSTDKRFRIEYRMLSSGEQTNLETLLDWIQTGAPVDFRPDDTAGATINMRLVLESPGEISNAFSFPTLDESDYPPLTFVEQLERT